MIIPYFLIYIEGDLLNKATGRITAEHCMPLKHVLLVSININNEKYNKYHRIILHVIVTPLTSPSPVSDVVVDSFRLFFLYIIISRHTVNMAGWSAL